MSSATTRNSRRTVWWCVIILFVFAVSKWPVISLPFFWDELGVYGAAGLYMHDHTLSLLPASMPPELSRGHPLLFTFVQAIGYHVFGDTIIGGHITALLITLSLLASIFYILRKLFSDTAALSAIMLLIVQPIFYAQSVLILPEIMLALWMLWTIYHWYQGNYLLSALFGSMAMLTKETALIMPVVIIVSEILLRLLRSRPAPRITWRMVFGCLTPLLVFGVFLLIQKQQMGWYFFPYHSDNVKISMDRIRAFSSDYLYFIFIEQGRVVLSVVMLSALLILTLRKHIRVHPFAVLLLIWCMGGIGFNSLSFYMNRYVLFVLIGGVILAAIVLHVLFQRDRRWLLLLPVLTMSNALFLYGHPWKGLQAEESLESQFDYDENMRYADYVRYMDASIDVLLDGSDAKTTVLVNFPISVALRDVRYGYTDKQQGNDFTLATGLQDEQPVERALLANPGSYEIYIPEDGPLQKVRVIGNGRMEFSLFTAR